MRVSKIIWAGSRLKLVHVRFELPESLASGALLVKPDPELSLNFRQEGTIYLTPGPGFGSGLHPTTRMCLSLLERAIGEKSPRSVLDAGTGTGILAVAAGLLGARWTLGVDVLAGAVATANVNITLNGVADRVEARHADVSDVRGVYDLIIANLYPRNICNLAMRLEKLLARGGSFILSGLTRFEGPRAIKRLTERRGLTLTETLWDQGWTTLLLRKPEERPAGPADEPCEGKERT